MSVKETALYDILHLSPNASQQDIKKSYNKLALKLHPDKGGNKDDFQKLKHAHEILSNPTKRSLYNKYGESLSRGQQTRGFGNFTNFFEMGFGGRQANNNFRHTNQDLHHTCNITLEQLCTHSTIKLKYDVSVLCVCDSIIQCSSCNGSGSITRIHQIMPGMVQQTTNPCGECKGTGKKFSGCSKCVDGFVIKSKIIELKLNPSNPDNRKTVFKNEGNQQYNKQFSDFIVTVKFIKHPVFILDSSGFIVNRTISLKDALTGYKEILTHPSGNIININTTGDIINPYDDYIIKGHGLTRSHNLHIKFKLIFPRTLDEFELKNQ